MARIFNVVVVSIIAFVSSSALACAEPMPLRASYLPVDATCDDGRALYRPGEPAGLDAAPAAYDWESLVGDELGLPGGWPGEEPDVYRGAFSGALYTPAVAGGGLRLASYGSLDPEPEVDAAPASRSRKKGPPGAKGAPVSGVVNINTGSAEQLSMLPGVGPSLAQRIVEYREKRPFANVQHLRRVKGIGRAKFDRIKDHVVTEGQTTITR
jgi:competence ComEA-like helix-hairpin-helix protein